MGVGMSSFKLVSINPEELVECLRRHPHSEVLEFVGISSHQYQIWLTRGEPVKIPVATWRLIQFQHRLHMAELLGSGWQDFYISRDTLSFPGIKYPLNAQDLRVFHLKMQELFRRQHEAERAVAELEKAEARLASMEIDLAFYRRECHLASRMGLMLAPLRVSEEDPPSI
jgi:hypothetical protein